MLAADTVHLWVAAVPAADCPPSLELLAPDERLRAARFSDGPAARAYVAARILLRQALAHAAGVAPQDWRFEADAHGRPWVVRPTLAQPLYFSLSHSAGWALCAIATRPEIGVDLEPTARNIELRNVQRVLAPPELAWVHAAAPTTGQTAAPDAPDARERLLRLWTLKEAYGKAVGRGLAASLSQVAFCCRAGRLGLQAPASARDWSVRQWQLNGRFVAALVYGAAELHVQWHSAGALVWEPLAHGPD